MGAHRRVIGAEGNMSAPKIRNPEGCRLRTSRISESWHGALVSRQVWVMGCLRDYVGRMTGLPRIAAELLRRPTRQSRATSGRSAARPDVARHRYRQPLRTG